MFKKPLALLKKYFQHKPTKVTVPSAPPKAAKTPKELADEEAREKLAIKWWWKEQVTKTRLRLKMKRRRAKNKIAILARRRNKQWPSYSQRRT